MVIFLYVNRNTLFCNDETDTFMDTMFACGYILFKTYLLLLQDFTNGAVATKEGNKRSFLEERLVLKMKTSS